MQKILMLGASGSLAKVVIPTLLKRNDVTLTLFVRNAQSVAHFADRRIRVVVGDVLDLSALNTAMQGQDVVYAGLAGELEKMADNVVQATKTNGVKRLIWISSMGIYGETGENYGAILAPYKKSAEIIENSAISYTIIRPAWFDNGAVDYVLTQKGERFQGTSVSRASIADLIGKIIDNLPDFHQKSLGIGRALS